jgi:uncharacterized protein
MLEVNIFLDENDLHQNTPMHQYIMRYLMHHSIMGATLFTASMGYGHKHHLHSPAGLGAVDEGPMMIIFVDEEEKVRRVLLHIREIIKEGLITLKNVEKI